MKLQSCSGFATKGLCTSFAPGSQHEIRRFWFNIFGKPGNPASCFWTTMTVFKNMRETAAFGAGWKHKAACMVMASYSNQIFSTQQLHCFVISSLLPMLSLGLIMTAWEEPWQPIGSMNITVGLTLWLVWSSLTLVVEPCIDCMYWACFEMHCTLWLLCKKQSMFYV